MYHTKPSSSAGFHIILIDLYSKSGLLNLLLEVFSQKLTESIVLTIFAVQNKKFGYLSRTANRIH